MRAVMALMVAATLAVPAMANGTSYAEGQVRVHTADLDLATARGQRLLDRRLSLAMARLCGEPVLHTRDELTELAACQADAMAAAAPQIDAARARRAVMVATSR